VLDEYDLMEPRSVLLVVQNFGAAQGGWGTCAVQLQGSKIARPLVYAGRDPSTIGRMVNAAELIARDTGKPTKVIRYEYALEIASYEP